MGAVRSWIPCGIHSSLAGSRTERGTHGQITTNPAFDHRHYRFLSYVDLLGTTYTASTLATGFGAYIAQPLLRKEVEGYEDVLTAEQAQKILEDCMRVLFYRDARSLDKVRTRIPMATLPLNCIDQVPNCDDHGGRRVHLGYLEATDIVGLC